MKFRILVLPARFAAAILPIALSISMPVFAQVAAPSPISPSQQLDLKAIMPPPESVPNVLTLDQAIRSATERNYTIQTGQNSLHRNQLEVTRSKDAFLPSASASAGYTFSYSLAPLSQRTTVIPGFDSLGQREIVTAAASSAVNYSIGASLNLFNGGADAARVRTANDAVAASQDNLLWSRQVIAYNVTNDYVTALRNNELVVAAQTTLAESNSQLARLKGLYQAGSIPIGQVYQQEAVVGQNEVSLIQAKNNFENSKADLLFLLNVSPNDFQKYHVDVTGIDTSTSPDRQSALDTAITSERLDAVIRNRPDILAAQYQLQSISDQIEITRGALLPRLDATVALGGKGDNSDLTKVQVKNGLSAGLSLGIPLFDRNQNRLLIEEQNIDLESQRVQIEQAVQQIRSDATKSVNNIRASEQALSASQRALTSARESLRLAEERLRVGAGTQVDVIIAQAQLETARTNAVNAKYNFVLAQRQLQFTLGQWNY